MNCKSGSITYEQQSELIALIYLREKIRLKKNNYEDLFPRHLIRQRESSVSCYHYFISYLLRKIFYFAFESSASYCHYFIYFLLRRECEIALLIAESIMERTTQYQIQPVFCESDRNAAEDLSPSRQFLFT